MAVRKRLRQLSSLFKGGKIKEADAVTKEELAKKLKAATVSRVFALLAYSGKKKVVPATDAKTVSLYDCLCQSWVNYNDETIKARVNNVVVDVFAALEQPLGKDFPLIATILYLYFPIQYFEEMKLLLRGSEKTKAELFQEAEWLQSGFDTISAVYNNKTCCVDNEMRIKNTALYMTELAYIGIEKKKEDRGECKTEGDGKAKSTPKKFNGHNWEPTYEMAKYFLALTLFASLTDITETAPKDLKNEMAELGKATGLTKIVIRLGDAVIRKDSYDIEDAKYVRTRFTDLDCYKKGLLTIKDLIQNQNRMDSSESMNEYLQNRMQQYFFPLFFFILKEGRTNVGSIVDALVQSSAKDDNFVTIEYITGSSNRTRKISELADPHFAWGTLTGDLFSDEIVKKPRRAKKLRCVIEDKQLIEQIIAYWQSEKCKDASDAMTRLICEGLNAQSPTVPVDSEETHTLTP